VEFGFNRHWEGGGGTSGAALSLKAPQLPIFWAIRMDIEEHFMWLNVSGDQYLIDDVLVSDINLHWYLGLGVGVACGFWDNPVGSNKTYIGATGRLPVGLSWQPIPLLEIYLQLVPHIGVQIVDEFKFPFGGWGGGLGIRLWF